MSVCRSQALINASPERIWELVGDPRRHPEWWPRVIEVNGNRIEEGASYAQVTKAPARVLATTMRIEQLDDLREIHMRCLDTGTYARWLLTEARGDTFVDVELGMEPVGLSNRVFDRVFGKLYFSRWIEQSLEGLESAAEGDSAPSEPAQGEIEAGGQSSTNL
jgi:hypothetical protein